MGLEAVLPAGDGLVRMPRLGVVHGTIRSSAIRRAIRQPQPAGLESSSIHSTS